MADERIKDSEIERLIEIEGITDPRELTENILISFNSVNQKSQTEFMEYVNERQLMQFLISPWLQTMLISLWMNNSDFKGSLCEINCILLDLSFKKGNAKEGYFRKGTCFPCLSNTSFIEPHCEILDALANAAFHFTFSSQKSLVFSKRELLDFMSIEQLQFCLDAGLLTVMFKSEFSLNSQRMSFVHETVQEFLAAYYIAISQADVIENLLSKHKCNVLEMSQIIIYMCGLACKIANELINRLTDGDFFNDMNLALSRYLQHFHIEKLAAFKTDYKSIENIGKFPYGKRDFDLRMLAVSFLFQRMMITGFIEAKASGQKDICLKCRDFIFNEYLNESESNALRALLMYNTSNVRTLILESNVLQISEILIVLQQSRDCLERVKARVTPEIYKAFYNLNLKELHFIGRINVSLIADMLTSLSKLKYLYIEDSTFHEEFPISATLRGLDLTKITFTVEFLRGLLKQLSLLKDDFYLEMCDVNVADFNKHILQSELLPIDMSNIFIFVKQGNNDLYGLLSCLPIVNIWLMTSEDAALASDILPTFSKLKTLYLRGTFMGRCDLQMPSSLNCISLLTGECTSEWLCSLLIKLSALGHRVNCELWNFVVQSRGEDSGADLDKHGSNIRSKLLSCDFSNFQILVKPGSKELFEIFRDTSIGSLTLKTADCVSLASDILPTLIKLEKLYLWGTFMGRCDLQMPSSLNCISLQTGECTSEWLCSLLIKLCALDHHIECELWNFVLQSHKEEGDADSNIHECDLRSKLLACDMSKIKILVENGSNELFEIFRDTSIGILDLKTADCVSLISDILPTLIKLEKLYLWGTFMGRCDLQMPSSLNCISLQTGQCTSEWLCSLLIKLCALDHLVKCELCDFVLQSHEEEGDADSNIHECDLRSKLLACNMSNINVLVTNGSNELFEIFRDTSIGILDLRTADCVSLTSDILPTLIKLEKLYLWGTFMGRYDLQMPSSLNCISLQTGKCSSKWLCSLLIKLSALGRLVKCELCNFVPQSHEGDCDADSNIHECDLRSELLACDMSNIEILVTDGSNELFEIFRETSIGILDLRTADCVSLTSDILPTLIKLEKLYLWGTFLGRCDLQMPSSLNCISLKTGECSSKWLCSLLIKLSALGHLVKCELCDFVLQSHEEDCDADLNIHECDLRSELLACDMSNIKILVKNGSNELFEIFRDTSIGILDLRTADCVSLTSDILPTLIKLEKLYLWGNFMGRCDLQMPSSLNCISLQTGECTSEWLCSLLIKLCALDHHIECELWNFVLQSHEGDCDADLNIHECDLRSELLACDMSNIEILVKNGSNELFEIFRDTSIGILDLRTADCVSLTSDILPTLIKLEKLYLWGTFMGRCDLQMPSLLKRISLRTGECTSEWLCSLLIKLSALGHLVKCELWNFVLQSHEEDCGANSNINVSDLRSKLLACDMSNIAILVKNGSKELFEIFRDTSIRFLDLRTAASVSLTSAIRHSFFYFVCVCKKKE
ncbi:hypothetical protein DPMN_187900 [Dreissena polymorpha]|uniref:Uncharacterized protein n=2 Tax=Dreissena polymorpha TaxID=45954 RepID=A0A9D4I9G4_DREPO|nr:hypothetical protein DPMN_187900 [Dreissena polymorpha]